MDTKDKDCCPKYRERPEYFTAGYEAAPPPLPADDGMSGELDHIIMGKSSWRTAELWAKHSTAGLGIRWMTKDGFSNAIAELSEQIAKGREGNEPGEST